MTETEAILLFYGTTWCGSSRRARLILDQNGIPYRWIDIDQDLEAAGRLEQIAHGCRSVPTLVWPDGSTLVEPSEAELRRKLGLG